MDRITTLNTSKQMVSFMSSQETRYNTLSTQISSGKKLTSVSQDPAACREVLNINTKTAQIQGYLNNMSAANQELNMLDSSLTSSTNLINKITDLATQAANGTYSDQNLDEIKIEVDTLIESLINVANTDYNGKYIFSGANTAQKAYSVTKDSNGAITGITYNGTGTDNGLARTVTISDGVTVEMNVAGSDVFGSYDGSTTPATGTGIFGTLMELSKALGDHDQSAVASTLSGLDAGFNTVITTQTKFAALTNKFDITKTSLDTTMTTLEEYRSSLQDTDLATAITELVASRTALQTTYTVASDLMKNTGLLNYL